MQLRVVKNIGTYVKNQRLTLGRYNARQLIALGIAVEDLSDAPSPEDDKPKRRYRRRDLTADGE